MVAQHAVGTLVIVLGAPRFKDDLRFEQAVKEFPVRHSPRSLSWKLSM